MKDIEIKQDLIKVNLKDKRVLYFPASKYAAFREALRSEQFVEIEGVLVNRNLIMTVEPERIKEDLLLNLPPEMRVKAHERFSLFRSNIGRYPTYEEKQKIIKKIQDELRTEV